MQKTAFVSVTGSAAAECLPRRGTRLIGVASAAGAPQPGCEYAPSHLQRALLASRLASHGIDAQWHNIIAARRHGSPMTRVAELCEQLADETAVLAANDEFFSVLGGDHSCAIGTWSGVSRSLRPRGSLGLIWLDAHLDSHVPRTSPSGAIHGMPLACLLGHGPAALTELAEPGPAILPHHACVVGAHSFETEEAALLERLGVRVFTMSDITRHGLTTVLRRALQVVRTGTAGFGISIDLDVIDPLDAPGVTVPVPGGLDAGELAATLANTVRLDTLKAVEIAEYNPLRDEAGRTARVISKLLAAAVPIDGLT